MLPTGADHGPRGGGWSGGEHVPAGRLCRRALGKAFVLGVPAAQELIVQGLELEVESLEFRV